MKIEISNNNRIVSSTFYEQNDLSFSIFINTVERWITPDFIESSKGELIFYFDSLVDEEDYDFVSFIAENEREIEMLNRSRYLLHEKDQLCYLLPSESVTDYRSIK